MTNILCRILFLILVVNLFVNNTVSADDRKKNKKQQYSASAIAEKTKTSIVTIKVYDKVGNNIGLGTGFFVSNNGKIVTNYHVIENATSVKVELENGEKFNDVYLLSSSQQRDIAVIKVPVENVTFIALGDDNKIKQGDQVYVFGNPLGLERTFSDGVVSAKRVVDGTQFIQITAPISQGSSGGPVLNKSGDAIAIASMIFTKGQNLNLSVPSKYIKPLIDTKEIPIKFDNTISLQTVDTNKHVSDSATGAELCKNAFNSKDYVNAFSLCLKPASDGNADAQYLFGLLYSDGKGVAKDSAEAVKWFRKAAEQGHAEAQYLLGASYYIGEGVAKDSAEVVKWTRKAAEQGHVDAQYLLGASYYYGEGVAKDSAEAVRWFRKAAEQGNADAQFKLGFLLGRGEGVAKDSAGAVKWYRKAAEQGHVNAQLNLGSFLQDGIGVAKDSAEAVRWFRKAAEQGDVDTQLRLGFIYNSGEGVAKDSAEAVKWFRKAAEQGNADAQFKLGYCYYYGEGVAKDSAEAVKWFRKAAEQGNTSVQYILKLLTGK